MFDKEENMTVRVTKALEEAHHEPKEEDTQMLRDVFGRLGTFQMEPINDVSALGFNESQFNCIGEDSTYNDVIEISAFAKPSMLGRFLDKDTTPENELVRRSRLISDIDQYPMNSGNLLKNKIKNKNEDGDGDEDHDGFETSPQYLSDLDTSGIAFDAPNHVDPSGMGGDTLHNIDKEFGDGSFMGFKEHNSHEAEDVNDFFDYKRSDA
jgi:hypothetical protein